MKKTIKDNYRVVVKPIQAYGSHPVVDESYCMSIAEQIKRHIDSVGSIELVHDTEDVCSFCNDTWEIWEGETEPDGYDQGSPVCCLEAMHEWKKEQKEND